MHRADKPLLDCNSPQRNGVILGACFRQATEICPKRESVRCGECSRERRRASKNTDHKLVILMERASEISMRSRFEMVSNSSMANRASEGGRRSRLLGDATETTY